MIGTFLLRAVVKTFCATVLMLSCSLVDAQRPAKPSSARLGSLKQHSNVIMLFDAVSSCSANACHGAPLTSTTDWTNSYTVWKQFDPHSNAFLTLQGERSRRIVAKLMQSESKDKALAVSNDEARFRAYLQGHCMTCHATILNGRTLPAVSCASCHGEGEWETEHFKSSWKDVTRQDKVETWGLRDTRDLHQRAAICVDCHVAPPGDPSAEVTHDLIAAGHPRLTFEFVSYLAALPPHWNEVDDRTFRDRKRHLPDEERERRKCDYQAEAWLEGQIATARRALEKLHDRASEAARVSSPPVAWPDWADYECFDCHHALQHRPSRQDVRFPRRPLGTPTLGKWNLLMVHQLAIATNSIAISTALSDLEKEFRGHAPDAKQVRELTSAALAAWDTFRPYAAWSEDTSKNLIADITKMSPRVVSWDESAQWYASVRGLLAARDTSTPAELEAVLDRLFQKLRFPEGFDSPRPYDPEGIYGDVKLLKPLTKKFLTEN